MTSFKKIPLRYLAEICNGQDKSDVEDVDGPFPIYGSGGSFSRSSKALYIGESVLLGRKGTIDNPLYVSGGFWTVDTMYYTKINTQLVIPKFLFYLCKTIDFNLYKTGSVLPSMTKEDLGSIKFDIPDIETQAKICSILDDRLSKIDKVIENKLKTKKKVLDYCQSLISRAVTKGLDPNVPMKNAGLDWLDRIPEHWSRMRLAHCFTLANRPANLDLPVLSVSIHTGISDSELSDEERDRKVWLSEDRSKYQSVKEGDLVYNMMRAWQGGFGTSTRSGLVSPAYNVLSPKKGIFSKYYELLFRTPNAQKLIYGYSEGIADFRKRLYWEKARDIYVPVPPYEEQARIVSKVTEVNDRIESTKKLISKQTKLLSEYRDSLISSFFASPS